MIALGLPDPGKPSDTTGPPSPAATGVTMHVPGVPDTCLKTKILPLFAAADGKVIVFELPPGFPQSTV